ncbi:MAG: hypothetical protein HYZ30_00310 [Candidatus Azosocius agrarius]|nr:MAG: hypothetical protein HYZ30_00310 [Gammaproteobacteria bacterium]
MNNIFNNYSMCLNEGFYMLSGSVVFDNMVDIYNCSINYFDNLVIIKINLSKLKIIDSSIFILILSWIKKANADNKDIYFYDLPKFILDLGKIYDFDLILSFFMKKN